MQFKQTKTKRQQNGEKNSMKVSPSIPSQCTNVIEIRPLQWTSKAFDSSSIDWITLLYFLYKIYLVYLKIYSIFTTTSASYQAPFDEWIARNR